MKLPFRIGLREKIAVLVTVLVTAVGLILPSQLFELTRGIVEEHGIVDLREQGMLRAWELVGRVGTLVEDVRRVSRDDRWVEQMIREGLGRDWSTHLQSPVRGDPAEYVRLEIVEEDKLVVATGYEPESPPAAAGSSVPVWRAGLLAAIRAGRKPGKVWLSPIHHAVLAKGQAPRPVVWAGAVCGAAEAGRVVLVLLDLELILGRNRTDPRHLYFLAHEDAGASSDASELHFAVHPDTALVLRDAPLADDRVFQPNSGIWEALATSKPAIEASDDAVRPIRQRLEGLKVADDYHFVEGTPDDRLRALLAAVATKTAADKQAAQKLRDFLYGFRTEMGNDTRAFLPRNAITQVRVLSCGGATIDHVLAEFPTRLAGFLREFFAKDPPAGLYQPGEKAGIHWGKPVRCKTCDAWMFHVRLRGDSNEHAYRLAYVAFHEELGYATSEEFRSLRGRALIFGLLAGALSFLIALWFVRPLDRITRTARSAADSAALRERMQEKINEVREALPVKRQDEVGDIARGLEKLLRELLNGHERLRQAKLDLDLQVAEQTRELREKNAQLEQLASDKDTFLGNVSHELRQPLNALFGFTQLLEFSDLAPEQRQDLGKIRKEAQHLLDLINDILDYQKIIMEGLDLEPEAIPLHEFLHDLRESMTSTAERRNNRLVVDCDGCPQEIRNDRKRLRQVLTNLLGNACKFTRDGVVTLRARPGRLGDRDWMLFEVIDTGRGMKPEEMARLFTKFAKLSSKEGNTSGTGLGLVISKGLCELMGGDITVESQFGKGSVFTVRVPAEVGDEEIPTYHAPRDMPAAIAPAPPPTTGPLVLVIDDDASVCELVERFLGEAGMRTVAAADGISGLAMARKLRPDVITLDAVMPEMDGWEVLSTLKSDPATADIPVVMVSFLEQRERGFALGAADYVVKPIDWPRLATVVERHLDGRRGSAILIVDDDEAAREIFRRSLEQRGWEVWEADHGRAALDIMATRLPGMILLDLMMPVMDGFEFIGEFGRHPEWQGIPVVVVTARDPSLEEKRRLEGSVVRILQKGSYGQDRLLEEIKMQVELQLRPPGTAAPTT